jgi:hypothetical protein
MNAKEEAIAKSKVRWPKPIAKEVVNGSECKVHKAIKYEGP